MSALEVWNCRKCSSIRSAPCASVCLPGDAVNREITQPLTTHPTARPAWVAYGLSVGYTREFLDGMTTDELITKFGSAA